MNKEDFLARCANAFDMGLVTPETIRVLERWVDMVMRYEAGQMNHWEILLDIEVGRTNNFDPKKTLANDEVGYKVIRLASILHHPCQFCAVDPEAWHTRSAFCRHGESLD